MAGDDEEDAPTKVQQTRRQFALGATVQDLRQVLERLTPADEETLTTTPKLHDLGAMLKDVQEERLKDLRGRHRKVTLRSGPTMKGDAPSDGFEENVEQPIRRSATARPPSNSGWGAPWPWMVAALGFGGLLVWLGTLVSRPPSVPPPDYAHVTWDISVKGASVTIGGQTQPNVGARRFSCAGGVELVVTRPGRPHETHNVACGGQMVVRLEEASPP